MKLKLTLTVLVVLSFVLIFESCQKEQDLSANVLSSEKIKLNAILELTELSKIAFQLPNVRKEIWQLGQERYYPDHYIPVEDLLNPKNNSFYNSADINLDLKGSFKKEYERITSNNPENYSNLLSLDHSKNGIAKNAEGYQLNGLTYYCPYCLDYSDTNFDPTIVPEIVDADQGDGYEPVGNGDYSTQLVDDLYAENTPTLLVGPWEFDDDDYDPGSGGSQNSGGSSSSHDHDVCDCSNVRQVFIGHAELREQYDNLISFTGNGGGSEIQILRVGGPLVRDANGTLNADVAADNASIYFSRRDIRRERKQWVADLWDNDWGCEPFEQILIVYEQDNNEDIDISGSIGVDSLLSASANYEVSVRTQDDIITQQTRNWREFFRVNMLGQGCEMWEGEGVFSQLWPIYECGTDFKYTMPHRCLD